MTDITWRWMPSDHVKASRAITRHIRGGTWLAWLPGLVAILLIFSFAVSFSMMPDRKMAVIKASAPWLIMMVLWFLFLIWGVPFLQAWRMKKSDPSVRAEMRHAITPEGFVVTSVAARVEMKWDHMVKVVETPGFFLFYYTRLCAYYTPKRAIAPDALPPLRAALKEYVGERAHLAG